VTAKTKGGKEIFRQTKIYMPQSPIYGRGDFMWSGGAFPGWKTGMTRDTSLQPGQTKAETFEIPFPYDVVQQDGKKTKIVKADALDVNIKLWYLPTGGDPKDGTPGKTQFLLFETSRVVKLKALESYIPQPRPAQAMAPQDNVRP
jgi:hypothetical protein